MQLSWARAVCLLKVIISAAICTSLRSRLTRKGYKGYKWIVTIKAHPFTPSVWSPLVANSLITFTFNIRSNQAKLLIFYGAFRFYVKKQLSVVCDNHFINKSDVSCRIEHVWRPDQALLGRMGGALPLKMALWNNSWTLIFWEVSNLNLPILLFFLSKLVLLCCIIAWLFNGEMQWLVMCGGSLVAHHCCYRDVELGGLTIMPYHPSSHHPL